jgi:N-acetylgalactosamine-N,N'-diacetylbacillosaminyl-diphospho-undecaprenol 4-alpha-N-acetylgalactosaminyltransferase
LVDEQLKSSVQFPRVLLVGFSIRGGGAEKRFKNICINLFGGNIDTCLLKNDSRLIARNLKGNVFNLGWKNKYCYPKIILDVRKIISRGKYDVVFGFGFYPNLIVWLATKLCRKRPIIILNEITRPWKQFTIHPPGLKKYLLFNLCKTAYRDANIMAANSIDGVEECIKYFGVSKEKIKLLPSVINYKETVAKANIRQNIYTEFGKIVIVTAARLVKMKRIDTLLEAVSLLPNDIEWSLVIAGAGPEFSKLRKLSTEMRIVNRVFFLGWVENPLCVLKNATIFVLCSEFEGFSNSVLEAMTLSVPVITSFCSTDARKMAEQGAALGFEPGDSKALAKNILKLIKSEKMRKDLIKTGRKISYNYRLNKGISIYEETIFNALIKH